MVGIMKDQRYKRKRGEGVRNVGMWECVGAAGVPLTWLILMEGRMGELQIAKYEYLR